MLIDDMSENEKVYHQLKNYYIEWIYITSYITPILRAILTHTSLAARQHIPGTDILLEELSKLGLIKFVKEDESSDIGALTCPYIWLWLMANASDDNVLHHWNFKYYNELQHKEDPYIPPGCPYWMHFEHFVASFRVIKSKIFGKDQQIKLKDIYAGAKHNFGEEAIINKPLSLEQVIHRESTKSSAYSINKSVSCMKGGNQIKLHLEDASACIINGSGAPSAGDSYIPIFFTNSILSPISINS
ncbi:uncharacterized protein OCT59_027992 [Rhizophagus irregularis]|uniref:uncharacterized protein n=1 Tax=Rhizophagus irregularis TaxID=588596 RepID=UPI0033216399|nr:hypothetical protein OCT59_027992 [Rhizophagus irregularis]